MNFGLWTSLKCLQGWSGILFYDQGELAILVTTEPVEFEKRPVEVQDECRKIALFYAQGELAFSYR